MRLLSGSMHPLQYKKQCSHTCAGCDAVEHFLIDHMHAPCHCGSMCFTVEGMETHCWIWSSPQQIPLSSRLQLSLDVAEPWGKDSSHSWFEQALCILAKVLPELQWHSQMGHPVRGIKQWIYLSVHVTYLVDTISINVGTCWEWMWIQLGKSQRGSIPFSDSAHTWQVCEDEEIFAVVEMISQWFMIECCLAPYLS